MLRDIGDIRSGKLVVYRDSDRTSLHAAKIGGHHFRRIAQDEENAVVGPDAERTESIGSPVCSRQHLAIGDLAIRREEARPVVSPGGFRRIENHVAGVHAAEVLPAGLFYTAIIGMPGKRTASSLLQSIPPPE